MNKDLKYYKSLPYQINTEPMTDTDGTTYWIAEYPDLRGCKTEGETETEAIANVQELFDEYIGARLEVDKNIPESELTPKMTGELVWVELSLPGLTPSKELAKEKTKETAGIFDKKNLRSFQAVH